MDNKQLLIIVFAIIIAGLIIGIGCFYGLSQGQNAVNNTTSNATSNMTNNTTVNVTKVSGDDKTNNEKASDSNNGQDNQKVEFNGRTHEENVQAAKESRDAGGQWKGATDEQIEQMVAQEERDGGRF